MRKVDIWKRNKEEEKKKEDRRLHHRLCSTTVFVCLSANVSESNL